MPSTPLTILFAGSGEFGVPTLRALMEAGHEVVQVVSQPDRPAGRGRKLTPTPIAQLALERGLSVVRTGNINTESLPAADVMVVIAFGQKIGEHIVHHARLGAVNLHASRLPKYRGAAPVNWAIIRGESITGNSIIRLAPKMDAGAVLGQSEVPIAESETAGELHDRLAADGVGLMLRVLNELAEGRAVPCEQDEALATLAPKLSRESARIDWTRPAIEIGWQVRGMSPWPGCRVRLVDASGVETARLTLVRAVANGCEGQRWNPGEVMMQGCIQCGGGTALSVLEVQPEGKRPMSLDAYRRGHGWSPGMRVESIA